MEMVSIEVCEYVWFCVAICFFFWFTPPDITHYFTKYSLNWIRSPWYILMIWICFMIK